jgi:hypothetical protein
MPNINTPHTSVTALKPMEPDTTLIFKENSTYQIEINRSQSFTHSTYKILITLHSTTEPLIPKLHKILKKLIDEKHILDNTPLFTYLITVASTSIPMSIIKEILIPITARLILQYPNLYITNITNHIDIIPHLINHSLQQQLLQFTMPY